MRSNISRRLKQLEKKANIHGPPQPVICVTFVSPEGPCQSHQAECGDQIWERARGETEENFRSRVRQALQRVEHSPTVVIFFPPKRSARALEMTESCNEAQQKHQPNYKQYHSNENPPNRR